MSAVIKTKLVRIGNSQGIRIPRVVAVSLSSFPSTKNSGSGSRISPATRQAVLSVLADLFAP